MSPVLLSEKVVTARKAHACMTCTATAIQPGDTYKRCGLVHDGSAYTWIQCAECDKCYHYVADWVFYDDDGIGPDHYQEWATESVIHATGDEQRLAKDFLARANGADQ